MAGQAQVDALLSLTAPRFPSTSSALRRKGQDGNEGQRAPCSIRIQMESGLLIGWTDAQERLFLFWTLLGGSRDPHPDEDLGL